MMGKQGNQKNEHHGREWLSFPDMSRIYDLKGGQGYDDDDPLDGDGGALHPVRTGYGAVGPGGRGGGGGDPGGGGAVPVHCGDAVPVDRGDGGDAAVRAGRKAVPAASTDAPAALSPGSRDRETMDSIAANVSANLLGLGNAATPLGLEAPGG